MSKYLIIFSHCIIQFCEFGFYCSLQPELSVDKVNSLLSFMGPFYLCFLELFYLLVISLPLSIDAILGSRKQVRTSRHLPALLRSTLQYSPFLDVNVFL